MFKDHLHHLISNHVYLLVNVVGFLAAYYVHTLTAISITCLVIVNIGKLIDYIRYKRGKKILLERENDLLRKQLKSFQDKYSA